MLRRVAAFEITPTRSAAILGLTAQLRGVAAYGVTLQSHEMLLRRFQRAEGAPTDGKVPPDAFDRILANLERVEQQLVNWKLNRWAFRVPVLVSASEKARSTEQLTRLKTEIRLRLESQQRMTADLEIVSRITKTPIPELRYKPRAWLQEVVSKLRWDGDVAAAKSLREAWVRLEDIGGREFQLLERLCCIYGLARLGTFESAFTNRIVWAEDVRKSGTGSSDSHFAGKTALGPPETADNAVKVRMDTSNPFVELMALVVSYIPTIDILFDFLGYNTVDGYYPSLCRVLALSLSQKYNPPSTAAAAAAAPPGTTPSDGVSHHGPGDARILFQHTTIADGKPTTEFLFATRANIENQPDLMYGKDGRVVLISIAKENKWLRETQMPHKKQMEGVARRVCFAFGLPFESASVQNLFLPPRCLDRASLTRLESVIGPFHPSVQSWLPLYTKELGPEEVDYTTQAKKYPQDEWVRL